VTWWCVKLPWWSFGSPWWDFRLPGWDFLLAYPVYTPPQGRRPSAASTKGGGLRPPPFVGIRMDGCLETRYARMKFHRGNLNSRHGDSNYHHGKSKNHHDSPSRLRSMSSPSQNSILPRKFNVLCISASWDMSQRTRAEKTCNLAVPRPPDLSPRPDW
jgi:hypothetical protein